MSRSSKCLAIALSSTVLCSCAMVEKTQQAIDTYSVLSEKQIDEPIRVAPTPRVVKVDAPYVPLKERALPRAGSWLRSKTVSISLANSVPLSQVLDMFALRGVNIVSEIPLDATHYVGTIGNTDAETALQIILGSCGLDYVVDDTNQLVRIKPMPSRTWFLNLGSRRSHYAAGSSSSGSASGSGSSNSSSNGIGAPSQSSGPSSGGTSTATTGSGGAMSISSSDDFWTSLHGELDRRLNTLVPASRPARGSPQTALSSKPAASPGVLPSPLPLPGEPAPSLSSPLNMGGASSNTTSAPAQAGTQDLYARKVIGSYSTNPETGSVTVQAPHWVLAELDTYIARIQQMYNTDITFTGELVLVNKTRQDTEGLDIAGFARFAQKYGAVVSNNSLGGVTVAFGENGSRIPSVAAGNAQIGGTLIGLTGAVDGLQVFNAWLAEVGNATVIQRPVISTTSGMPAEFSKTVTRYYNTVNQQTAAGGSGSAAVGTQNTLVPVNLGTVMRINPRFDITTGLIRTQIAFNQSVQSASQNISQTVTAGTALQSITSSIPVVTQIAYSGETLLRNGDLIIVGGQSEENLSADERGLPEPAGWLRSILGTKSATRSGGTFYLALRVQITPR